MKYLVCLLWRRVLLFTFLLSLILPPSVTYAVVGDVTLTGLPPNETVSLTNEETKERVEQKTDDRGFVIIPLTGKSWQSGRHSVTCQVDGKPVASKIFLRDGANRVDLTSLTYSAKPLDPTKAQKIDEALKRSTTTLKANPSDHQALLTQGAALNRLGRHSEALSKLAQASKMSSTHPVLAFETGWSLMRLGMYPEAIAQLEKYEKMRPGLGQTSEFIGRSHLFLNELDKADAKLKEALQRDPKLKSTALFHLAILEALRENPQAASNYINTLLKEAPNSPTAQLFKNSQLKAPGAKPPAGAGAKDFKLSDPIKIQLPPTTAGDVAGAVARGLAGTLLGGLFGGRRRDEDDRPDGPKLTPKPNYPEWTFASKDGKTKVNLSGALRDGKPNIVMGVKESPGNGAPHLIMLQDKNCNVMQPTQTSVTNIWEQWAGWKLTVSWTKSYYQDGRLVKQEKGGWSTPWNIFRTQINDPSEIPGIWKDFGDKPFGSIREVMSSFEPPPGIPFNPADWNLITHATTDAGNNQLVTAPFVTGLGTDQNNNFIFTPMGQTACDSAPPSVPLVAGLTTFPWTVGPFGIGITSIPRDDDIRFSVEGIIYDFQGMPGRLSSRHPEGLFFGASVGASIGSLTETKTRPGTVATTETRPDGTKIKTDPDGHMEVTRGAGRVFGPGLSVETRPDGTVVVTHPTGRTDTIRPDGSQFTTYPDGNTVEHFGDKSAAVVLLTKPDGTRSFHYYPSDTVIEVRPDGTKIMGDRNGPKTVTFPDGSSVRVGPDGLPIFTDPPPSQQPTARPAVEPDVPGLNDPDPPPSQQPAEGPPAVFPGGVAPDPNPDIDVPGLEDNYNAPPVDQVM